MVAKKKAPQSAFVLLDREETPVHGSNCYRDLTSHWRSPLWTLRVQVHVDGSYACQSSNKVEVLQKNGSWTFLEYVHHALSSRVPQEVEAKLVEKAELILKTLEA